MKYIYAISIVLAGILAFGNSAEANPGESASYCVDFSSGTDSVIASNQCGQKVFIIYCGDLSYSNQRCGDGPDGGYYTHSHILQAGDTFAINVDGNISYGSCLGGISFGNEKFNDDSSGGYRCLE